LTKQLKFAIFLISSLKKSRKGDKMKRIIILLAIIFFVFISARVEAENIFQSKGIYGPEDFQGSLSWNYLSSWWLSYLETTTYGEFSVGLGLNFPEIEIFDYNTFEAVKVNFQSWGGLVFIEEGLAQNHYFLGLEIEFSDWKKRIFLRNEQMARFTEDNFGWWNTSSQIFFRRGKSFFGLFLETCHQENFLFSFFGPLYKNRVSKKFIIETFVGINPDEEKIGGVKLFFAIP